MRFGNDEIEDNYTYRALPVDCDGHEGTAPRDFQRPHLIASGNDWLSPPVTTLGGAPIHISFDDQTHEYHRYTYRIEHCEADWSVSEEIFTSDYIDGFTEGNLIEDIEESLNTNVLYTHYHLSIPNEHCRLKMSGNYRITVLDDNNDEEPMFSACFMVVDPRMSISLGVTTNTDIDVNQSHQQVSMLAWCDHQHRH